MSEEDDSQKTEDPTEKKLSKAREKGQVAQSQEIKTWTVLLGGTFALMLFAPWIMRNVRDTAKYFVEQPHQLRVDEKSFVDMFADVSWDMILVLSPFLAIMVLLSIAANVGQVGWMIAGEKIKPEFSKISLLKGVKKMFSMKSIVEFLKGILKLVIVGVVSFGLALPLLGDIEIVPSMHIMEGLERLFEIAIRLAAATVAVMTAIAVFDYTYQRYTFMKEMRMTKQEVKDEHKNAEGDPHVKGRIRKLRVERARQRMMAAVPEADVVITNPTHYAVALKYDMMAMQAPKCVAKGVDKVAFRIREKAEEFEVSIVENPPLARALFAAVEIDEEIPPEHYKAVAEIIGYVMRLKNKIPGVEKEKAPEGLVR